jgi:hypothetical protein
MRDEAIKHYRCGRVVTWMAGAWWCEHCKMWCPEIAAELKTSQRNEATEGLKALMPKPFKNTTWPKQPRSSKNLPDHPE